MKRKSLAALAATVVVAAGLTVGAAAPANAINRSACGADYLQLFSSSTTCWANAGTIGVTLYGVVGLSSGNNAGKITGPGFSATFAKYVSSGWPGSYTVTSVHIN